MADSGDSHAEQIKALVRCHGDADDNRFYAVAMQIAAQAARAGQGQVALELRDIVDQAKAARPLGDPEDYGADFLRHAELMAASRLAQAARAVEDRDESGQQLWLAAAGHWLQVAACLRASYAADVAAADAVVRTATPGMVDEKLAKRGGLVGPCSVLIT